MSHESAESTIAAYRAERITGEELLRRLLPIEFIVPAERQTHLTERITVIGFEACEDRYCVVFTTRDRALSSALNVEPEWVSIQLDDLLRLVPPNYSLVINHGSEPSCEVHWAIIQDAIPDFGAAVLSQEATDQWLQMLNDRFAAIDLSPEKRPWQTLAEWEKETGYPLSLGSARAKRIFQWFERNTKPGVGRIGPLFVAAYYFDASFWPVKVPFMYGEQTVDPVASLEMSAPVLNRFRANAAEVTRYAMFWADCYDYGYGTSDLLKSPSATLADNLIAAARDQIASAVAGLLQTRPNPRAAESSALAAEILLKAFLAFKDGLTEEIAKKRYSHGIPDLLIRCIELAPNVGFEEARREAGAFPALGDRYKAVVRRGPILWQSFRLAIHIGAVVMRQLTDRDARRGMHFG